MTAKLREWIGAQIESSKPGKALPRVVPQLVDAAASLRGLPAANRQAFGLVLPTGGVDDSEALAQRCLMVVAEWLTFLAEADRDEIGLQLARLGLPPLVARPELPKAVARLDVFVRACVSNFETGDEVHDPNVFAALDGVAESSGISLVELPCIDAIVGARSAEILPTTERWRRSWAVDGVATLAYDPSAKALRCRLGFDLTRSPEPEEVALLLEVIRKELFFTGWGMNLEWETEAVEDFDDRMVSVGCEVIEHRLTRLKG